MPARRTLPAGLLQARPGAPTAAAQPALLLCVPSLYQRCPSLAPLEPRLWRSAVAALHPLPPAQLAACLLGELGAAGGKAGEAAALLGNLLEGAPAALRGGDARLPALHFCQLAAALLALLPTQLFQRPAGSYAAEDDDDVDQAATATAPERC
jgi:hypothetical protein